MIAASDDTGTAATGTTAASSTNLGVTGGEDFGGSGLQFDFDISSITMVFNSGNTAEAQMAAQNLQQDLANSETTSASSTASPASPDRGADKQCCSEPRPEH